MTRFRCRLSALAITRRPWSQPQPDQPTWYEPLTDGGDIAKAVHWVLARPGVFLCTSSDTQLLPKVLEAARTPAGRPANAQMEAMLQEQATTPLFSA